MRNKQRRQKQKPEQTPGAMLAKVEEARIFRGGKEIAIENSDELLREYRRGVAVLPPRLIMLDDKDPEKTSPAAVVLDELARQCNWPCFLNGFFMWPSEDGLGNAHEVAEGLMVDLMLAGRADGWVWIMGDVRTEQSNRYHQHSWLEYNGWAVDASCGLVKIYPASWYRAVFKVRRLKVRDAKQTYEMWRRHGATELLALIDERSSEKTVRTYDFTTRKVTEIPSAELAPGMIPAEVAGVAGKVWIDATQVKKGNTYYHEPFPAETRQQIAWIADVLKEVYPISLTEWEDRFRQDLAAERHIFIHSCIAETYRRCNADNELHIAQKRELYGVIVQATLVPREAFLSTMNVSTITRHEAIAAANLLWRIFHERGGVEKCRKWDAELERRIRDISGNKAQDAA